MSVSRRAVGAAALGFRWIRQARATRIKSVLSSTVAAVQQCSSAAARECRHWS